MQHRGKTGKGSKTMMDVLIPVAERFHELVDRSRALTKILRCQGGGACVTPRCCTQDAPLLGDDPGQLTPVPDRARSSSRR